MVGEEAAATYDLHAVYAVVGEHTSCDLCARKPGRQGYLSIFLETGIQRLLNYEAGHHCGDEDNPDK